ncbi:hypothetical protein ANN_14229 [Periplaneta americana]|uniref:Uncharacterized protein n=1 Tax=Periplaneta americana TaxID=6978 RepID=A0ABQ8SX59_PERAM|nr:hypothetical protein ANN_14229 [Periplaneta americana]
MQDALDHDATARTSNGRNKAQLTLVLLPQVRSHASNITSLNPLDFLWGKLKTLVYATPVDYVDALLPRIFNACNTIYTTPGVFEQGTFDCTKSIFYEFIISRQEKLFIYAFRVHFHKLFILLFYLIFTFTSDRHVPCSVTSYHGAAMLFARKNLHTEHSVERRFN